MDDTAIRDPVGGVNQSGVRDHNERLILSLIQRHGGLSSADIARRSTLSAQTVSIIIRALVKDGLLIRGTPMRGKVGKPSVPLMLNPDGLLSLGLNIGRKSADLVLIDGLGTVRAQLKRTYAYPTPASVLGFLEGGMTRLTGALDPAQRARIAGIGVAAPFQLWNWLDAVNLPIDAMMQWKDLDLAGRVGAVSGLTVFVQNDTTAACTAEHVFGRGRQFADYAYFFIGSFVGGGVVLNDTVYSGRTGNAGAFGTLPVRPGARDHSQLIHNASIYLLEQRLEAAGIDPAVIWQPDHDWDGLGDILTGWIEQTARHLAVAAVAVSSVIDFQRILIDANCPAMIRAAIVARTVAHVGDLDIQGIDPPVIEEASIGRNARAIGAAALPILARYFLSQPGIG